MKEKRKERMNKKERKCLQTVRHKDPIFILKRVLPFIYPALLIHSSKHVFCVHTHTHTHSHTHTHTHTENPQQKKDHVNSSNIEHFSGFFLALQVLFLT